MHKILAKTICYHRGLGKENSLDAVKNAILLRPFMVEFDIQNDKGIYYLGHPPKINYDYTLEDALLLYKNSVVIPKIDIKCSLNWKADIDLLIKKTEHFTGDLLINVGGGILSSSQFMDAESYLLRNSKPNMLLNIDIARYKDYELSVVKEHIKLLPRLPFSISPMIESNYKSDIETAINAGIQNIHFWSNNSKKCSENELVSLYNKYSSLSTKVLFDINPNIIV